mmetsp:Transcript_5629/g.16562  ORF Transcript_5629/g.16562 Transcript_5629/m.16562 type:complete len:216 (-) Transcript_5629:17-664(-)
MIVLLHRLLHVGVRHDQGTLRQLCPAVGLHGPDLVWHLDGRWVVDCGDVDSKIPFYLMSDAVVAGAGVPRRDPCQVGRIEPTLKRAVLHHGLNSVPSCGSRVWQVAQVAQSHVQSGDCAPNHQAFVLEPVTSNESQPVDAVEGQKALCGAEGESEVPIWRSVLVEYCKGLVHTMEDHVVVGGEATAWAELREAPDVCRVVERMVVDAEARWPGRI